jgi:hypothetical protein
LSKFFSISLIVWFKTLFSRSPHKLSFYTCKLFNFCSSTLISLFLFWLSDLQKVIVFSLTVFLNTSQAHPISLYWLILCLKRVIRFSIRFWKLYLYKRKLNYYVKCEIKHYPGYFERVEKC